MKRETGLFATFVFLVVTVSLTLAQDPRGKAGSALPSDTLGPQLIAWSHLQKPQPVSQPLVLPEQPSEQPNQKTLLPASPPAQPPAAQTFTGTIVKDSSRYILNVSSNTAYQIDDQDKAKQYEGKRVKIAGSLDANGNNLHITSIELVS